MLDFALCETRVGRSTRWCDNVMLNDTQYISKSLRHNPTAPVWMDLIQWEARCQREQPQLTAVVHLEAELVGGGACFGYKTES